MSGNEEKIRRNQINQHTFTQWLWVISWEGNLYYLSYQLDVNVENLLASFVQTEAFAGMYLHV